MRKCSILVSTLVVAALAITGCSTDGEGSTDEPEGSTEGAAAGSTENAGGSEDGRYQISMIGKAYAAPYWQATANGAKQAGEDFDVDVTFNGPDTELEFDKQVNMLQSAIDSDPDGIGLAPLDSAVIAPLASEANAAGIPVIGFDTVIEGADSLTTIATDNPAAGAEAARNMIRLVGTTGKIAVLAHSQTAFTSVSRVQGFVDYIEANSDLEIVSVQYNDVDQAKAANQAAAVLQTNPDLLGFFCTEVSSAVAASHETASAGRTGEVTIIGFDSSEAQQDLIRKGEIAGAVTQNPYAMGYLTVQYLIEYLNGNEVPENIDSGFSWYDKDNIDDPDIQQMLYE